MQITIEAWQDAEKEERELLRYDILRMEYEEDFLIVWLDPDVYKMQDIEVRMGCDKFVIPMDEVIRITINNGRQEPTYSLSRLTPALVVGEPNARLN